MPQLSLLSPGHSLSHNLAPCSEAQQEQVDFVKLLAVVDTFHTLSGTVRDYYLKLSNILLVYY